MKNKRRVFSMNMFQVLTSPVFYISILGILVVSYFSTREYLGDGKTVNVVYIMDLLLNLTMFKNLIFLLSALTYCSSFCSDWNFQYIRPLIIRSGIKNYIRAKVITCALTSFLVAFIGMMLYSIILSIYLPIRNYGEAPIPPYGQLLEGRFPFLYLLVVISIYSMAASMWSVAALAFSSYIPNSLVAITSPIICSYLLEEITTHLPTYLDIYYLTRARDIIHKGPALTFIYTITIFLILTFLFGVIFSKMVERRVNNEVV